MRSFQANGKGDLCFRKYRQGSLWIALGLGIFITMEILSSYFKFHQILYTIFYSVLGAVLYVGTILAMYKGTVLTNKSIRAIEINEDKIKFQTFSATIFWGLAKKDRKNIELPKKLAEFKLAGRKYGFNKKYTGDIYLLTYAGDEFLVQSNFFDDFPALRESLETK